MLILHAHVNVSGNCVHCIDAEFPILMYVSVLSTGTQLLRVERLSACSSFFTNIYIIKCYVYNINFIHKNLRYLTASICVLIKWSVISIFVVTIFFDSSFSVRVFARAPFWEMLRFPAAIIWLSENPRPMWIESIASIVISLSDLAWLCCD